MEFATEEQRAIMPYLRQRRFNHADECSRSLYLRL
jgi:hypothetical protein